MRNISDLPTNVKGLFAIRQSTFSTLFSSPKSGKNKTSVVKDSNESDGYDNQKEGKNQN